MIVFMRPTRVEVTACTEQPQLSSCGSGDVRNVRRCAKRHVRNVMCEGRGLRPRLNCVERASWGLVMGASAQGNVDSRWGLSSASAWLQGLVFWS